MYQKYFENIPSLMMSYFLLLRLGDRIGNLGEDGQAQNKSW